MGKKGKGKQPQGRAKARGKAQKNSPRSGTNWAADFARGQAEFGDDGRTTLICFTVICTH
jgi:hypothetical protein